MKLKYIVFAQIIFLLLAVVAGNMLSNDLVDGPRAFHRAIGMLAGLLGIAVFVYAYVVRAEKIVKMWAAIALAFTFWAALNGTNLDSTDNYQQTYDMMRLTGTLALLSSIATIYQLRDETVEKESE